MNGDGSGVSSDLSRLAECWAEADIDAETQDSVRRALAAGDAREIEAGFRRPLVFGTAGLRGEVGAGPGRMNLATVSKVSFGLGTYLLDIDSDTGIVVVGYDARPDSSRFANCVAAVLRGLGLEVFLSSDALPTPCVAFAVRHLHAVAGVVVTASHNPRPDNGLKVFDSNGVQISSPWDGEISRRMENAPPPNEMRVLRDALPLPSDVLNAYFDQIRATAQFLVPEVPHPPPQMKIAYSPLHGVGWSAAKRALEAPLVELLAVPEQREPNGNFPTLDFPNPEEPGALDLLLQLAREEGCEAAIANDPDADRCALCLPESGGEDMRPLSGDALGLLLADMVLRKESSNTKTIVSTVVSSPILESLVKARGARLERTLTGFKWICRAALTVDNFAFAYEEAIGYCFAPAQGHTAVMDKDGICALLVLCRLLQAQGGGQELRQRLDELYSELGLWGSYGHSRRYTGSNAATRMSAQMARLRLASPLSCGGLRFVDRVDYAVGAESRAPYLGAQDLLSFELEGDEAAPVSRGRILVRPSGTEPKLKVYVHLCSDLKAFEQKGALLVAQQKLAQKLAERLLGDGP